MNSKELLELVVQIGASEVYRQVGPINVLKILSEQKTLERAHFQENHELQFSANYAHLGNRHKRILSPYEHSSIVLDAIFMHGVRFDNPIAFCKFYLQYDKVQQDEFGVFYGTPWFFCCTSIDAPGLPTKDTYCFNFGTDSDKQELIKTALSYIINSKTIFVWGEEQLKFCNYLIGESKQVIDMQSYTMGYYFQEQRLKRILEHNNSLQLDGNELQPLKSVQSLYRDLHEESLLEYLYVDMVHGNESIREKLKEKLFSYCMQDTTAMMELFNIWKH